MASDDLADRVRAALAGRTVREVRMFGGLSFMVDERLLVAVRDRALLVRIDPERHEHLTTRPGAAEAVMGKDRAMGPGWITVDVATLANGGELDLWLGEALRYHASQGDA